MPAISVIVPVYKAETTLRESVKSILDQTFRDFELILVDDGSPDNSGALCDTLAGEDSRIRVIHQTNGGVSVARNTGLASASGDYIYFCDADDTITPDALEKLYSVLTEAEADTAGCGHYLLWPDGRKDAYPAALPAGTYDVDGIRSGILLPLLGQRLDFGQGVLNGFVVRFLFRRSILTEHNIIFEGAYLEDEAFLMEYFLHAKRLAIVDEPFYIYLQNPASVTRNYLPDYLGVFRRFMERKRVLAEKSGLASAMPDWEVNSNWAGLLIAIGNEYAPSNPKSFGQKNAYIRSLCREPEMAHAIAQLQPKGLAGNKQLVADLVCKRQFLLLSLLYSIKNRRR